MAVEQFTERDLVTLAAACAIPAAELRSTLAREPWKAVDLLGSDTVFDSVMDRQSHPADLVSPNLLFSVLVHRSAHELRSARYVNEWVGVRSRLPVFDISTVHEYLNDPSRVAFLADLLTTFVKPSALPVPVDDRFDLVSIAQWLDAVEESDRVVLLRNLGDLALFLSGVFPDSTGSKEFTAFDAERLGATAGLCSEAIAALCDSMATGGIDAYETLGSKWYEAVSVSRTTPIVADISYRFRAARQVLNHVADRFLFQLDPGFNFA